MLVIAGAAGGIGLPGSANSIFSSLFESKNQFTKLEVFGIACLLPLFFLLKGLFGFLGNYLMVQCCLAISLQLQNDVFGKLQSLDLGYFSNKNTGDLITRVNRDISEIQDFIITSSKQIIQQPLQSIFAFAYLGYLTYHNENSGFIIFFVICVPFFLIPVSIISKKLKKRSMEFMQSLSAMTQHVVENLSALEEIRSFNLEKIQVNNYLTKVKQLLSSQLKISKYELLQIPSMEIIVSFGLAASLYTSQQNQIPLSTFLAMFLALYLAFDPIKQMMKIISQASKVHAPATRLKEILNAENPIKEVAQPKPFPKDYDTIEFKNISFKYETELILSNINLSIPKGSFVAFVGPSGSGKSTITKMLPRFYEAFEGDIFFGQNSIKELSIKDLRDSISIVNQRPNLFNDTVYSNISIGKLDATEEDVIKAATAAHAHSFITENLEQGYQSLVGNAGNKLSGGQMQRIALARAFLKNAPILILDEATSALDSKSEQLIQSAIQTISQNKTVIAIAHRLSTIQHADKIFFIKEGQVVDQGTFKHLYQENQSFKTLVDSQYSNKVE
jgi:subfamily B ATP-binding cassette protein MsbA